MSASLKPYLEGFSRLPEAAEPRLRALQAEALKRAEARGFPGPRDEAWKYSSTAALEKRAFAPSALPVKLDAARVEKFAIPGFESDRLVFVNGRYEASLSKPPRGLRVEPLSSAGTDALAAPTGWEEDVFLNLNTALTRDGLLLTLEAGARLDSPIEILHISALEAAPSSHHLRLVLSLGDGAQATLVERYAGIEGAQNLTNAVTRIELGARAKITHVRLQSESASGFHVGRVLVSQRSDSHYTSHNLQLGAAWSRLDLHTRLESAGAGVVLRGLYAVNKHQHIDNHTRIDHLVPGTLSDELYRGILDGQGRAVFNGKVVVAEGAVKTDARQANHNLLLSRGAEIDTKPELEIYADDVKCSHGATIGQLDEQQLFYLRSRGLDAETARGLLIAAFAGALLGALPHPALTEHARRLLVSVIHRAALPEHA